MYRHEFNTLCTDKILNFGKVLQKEEKEATSVWPENTPHYRAILRGGGLYARSVVSGTSNSNFRGIYYRRCNRSRSISRSSDWKSLGGNPSTSKSSCSREASKASIVSGSEGTPRASIAASDLVVPCSSNQELADSKVQLAIENQRKSEKNIPKIKCDMNFANSMETRKEKECSERRDKGMFKKL